MSLKAMADNVRAEKRRALIAARERCETRERGLEPGTEPQGNLP